jgi:hypothetical protein
VTGLLTCLDGYMNVVLDQTEEWAGGRKTAEYGECFLRGNNGECASRQNMPVSLHSVVRLMGYDQFSTSRRWRTSKMVMATCVPEGEAARA